MREETVVDRNVDRKRNGEGETGVHWFFFLFTSALGQAVATSKGETYASGTS